MVAARRLWVIAIAVLVAAIAVLAVLLWCYTVPSKSMERTEVEWFGGHGSSTGANGTGQSFASPFFYGICPPVTANGAGLLTLLWTSSSPRTEPGLAVIYLPTVSRTAVTQIYYGEGINASFGGYTMTVPRSSPMCIGMTFVSFGSGQAFTVSWTLSFSYNCTTKVPLF